MPKCRSTKCIEKYKKIVRRIMSTIPVEYRMNYEEVCKYATPHISLAEWKTWKFEESK